MRFPKENTKTRSSLEKVLDLKGRFVKRHSKVISEMIPGTNACFPNMSQGTHMYPVTEDVVHSALDQASCSSDAHANSLLYSLSLLKDKVHQVQSLVSILVAHDQNQLESTSVAIANMGTMIQDIIVTASSMMFTSQQLAIGNNSGANIGANPELHPQRDKGQEIALSQPNFGDNRASNIGQARGQVFISGDTIDHWYGDNYSSFNSHESNRPMNVSCNSKRTGQRRELTQGSQSTSEGLKRKSPNNYDIVELDAADLLAKYTHYCQVCGKGFKRDANLRMHMRAHGDEYKTSAALTNPRKNTDASMGDKVAIMKLPRKYSCPQEGCRWNQKHVKFQPLKSMICAKNHYKRSHCPKMYVCKRCNRKQFSVLSDLRTHEKHCGDLKWQCSCGTTFSRKDKLMGHVALFVGHTPAVTSLTNNKPAKAESHPKQMQLDDR